MNVEQAAENTLLIWEKNSTEIPNPVRSDDGKGLAHQAWLLEQVRYGQVEGEKAHRWLSYAQGVLVMSDVISLTDCKYANVFT